MHTWFPDMDECDTGKHQCDESISVCHNTEGSFECVCLKGYSKSGQLQCTGNNSRSLNWKTQILLRHVLRLGQVSTLTISYFHVFERCTSTGSKFYSPLICRNATKFVLPSTSQCLNSYSGGCPKIWAKLPPKKENRTLPIGVRR